MKNKILILICLIFLISLSCVSASDINQTNTENVDNTILSTSNNVNVDNILSADENIDVNDNLSSYENYGIDNLTSDEGEFIDASEGYERLNAFRTENGVWQWNNDDTTRTVFNTNDTNQLKPLVRDTALEETAKIRAKELATKYSHTRPDGSSCWTAFPDGYWAKGENIAWGQRTWNQVTEAWKETEDPYSGQGHRRNMLNPNFNSVGVAGYKLNGVIYWAQDFGGKNNAEVLTKINPENAFTIKNNTLKPEFNIQLPNNATGNFIVKIDGNIIDSKTLSNGKATITANDLSTGTHEAILSYGGDSNYYTVNQIATINVTQINPINPTPTDNSTGTFTDLNNLIQSSENAVIKLERDYAYNKNTDNNLIEGIEINKEITIDGQCHTIDGTQQARIFNINSEVNLKNINFINSNAYGDGGAIYYFECIDACSVVNCTFINNTADYGGAIRNIGSVYNCTFINNTASDYAGAIYCVNSIYNCTFINNKAEHGGAIYWIDSAYNCTFINNSASEYGGAINSYDAGSVYNSTFINNTASEYGGAIYLEYGDIHITDSNFIGNDKVDFIYYVSLAQIDDVSIYLNNNTMRGVNPYDIWFNSENPITSPIYLVFSQQQVEKGETIEIGTIKDDNGNIIRMDKIQFKIYKENTLIDENSSYYEDGYYYTCNLDCGVYKVTGDISSDYATDLTVINGELIVENPVTKKIPIISTTVEKNKNDVTLTTTLNPSNVTGNVTFNVNGENYEVNVKDGKATKTLYSLSEGSYTVKTTYNGNNYYNKTNAEDICFDISSTYTIEANDLTKYYGGSERFIVTLKDKANKAVADENVTITINGQTYIRTTNSNGEASMAINLDSGEYDVLSQYKDYTVSSKVTIKSTISARDVTKIFRNGTQYYATFLDTKGNLLKNTAVGFNINGVFYTRYTNENGVARLNINLNPGTYLITATNPSSNEQHSNNITVLPSIVENYDLTKYYKNGTQYWVKILKDDGTAVGAGVSVSFNINGVFYTRTTNELGYVRLNINLDPNTYIITVMYNNLMVSNTIKVLPVLSANNLNMYYRDGSKFEAKLVDGQGNVLANQLITFNINGVFYDRMTNDNGIAMLNINLMPGKYIITSMYSNGASISNNVTIKLRLN